MSAMLLMSLCAHHAPPPLSSEFGTYCTARTLDLASRFKALTLGGVPREQKMLKGHIPRVIHH